MNLLTSLLILASLLSCQLCWGFYDISAKFSSNRTKEAVDITIQFSTSTALTFNEEIVIQLPYFTRRVTYGNLSSLDITYGSVILSPSTSFMATWVEGEMNDYIFELNTTDKYRVPYGGAHLKFRMKHTVQTVISGGSVVHGIPANTTVTLKVYKRNGIGAWCGFPDYLTYDGLTNVDKSVTLPWKFEVYSNTSSTTYQFISFGSMGRGCEADSYCNGNGICDFCLERCYCYEGYGARTDVVTTGYQPPKDCSQKTCPVGKSLAKPNFAGNFSRPLAECSDRGVCDRNSGQCKCSPPFSGTSCEKIWCPNDCSGHGQCLQMSELSRIRNPNSYEEVRYGTGATLGSTSWDWNVIHGCLCDSRWEVGYGRNQYQLSEWFGPDCSQRRCPSGDSPFTRDYEEDCFKANQALGLYYGGSNYTIEELRTRGVTAQLGSQGNYCHIDCSNRGICDYSTGTCTCFDGSWGDNCAQVSNGGGANYVASYDNYTDLYSDLS